MPVECKTGKDFDLDLYFRWQGEYYNLASELDPDGDTLFLGWSNGKLVLLYTSIGDIPVFSETKDDSFSPVGERDALLIDFTDTMIYFEAYTSKAADVIKVGNGGCYIENRGGDDVFIGGTSTDVYVGSRAGETMSGRKGDDSLTSGGGSDVMSGGGGNDFFRFGKNNTEAAVTDFELKRDTLIVAVKEFDDLKIKDAPRGAKISYFDKSGDDKIVITLEGIDANDLSKKQFDFEI